MPILNMPPEAGPETMVALLAWLQPNENPLFVLLPEPEYTQLQSDWQLPELPR